MKKIGLFLMAGISVFLFFSLIACSQPVSPLEDTATDGQWVNPDPPEPEDHFFFLPPLGAVPDFEGTFAAGLEPVVRVGILDEGSLLPLAEFTVDGRGSEKVRQSFSDGLGDFYIVNMNLKRYDVSPGMELLIEVFAEDQKLGELPAVLIANGSGKKTGYSSCPLVINRTVPIKFRIEEEFFDSVIPGFIEVWGSPAMPDELSDVPYYDDFIALALGSYHGIGLRVDGSLVSWGLDTNGQIAGTPGGTGFIAVDAGLLYSMALHGDGTVYAWGGGLGGSVNAPSGSGFTSIAAGYGFALALNEAGEIIVWSYSGNFIDSVPSGSGYSRIRAGEDLALAFNSSGQLVLFGNSTEVLDALIPGGIFLSADAGEFHAAGVLSDGRLVSWGGQTAADNDLIQDFSDGPYRSVALGTYLGVGLREDGTLRAFGSSAVADYIPSGYGYAAVASNRDSAVAAIRRFD